MCLSVQLNLPSVTTDIFSMQFYKETWKPKGIGAKHPSIVSDTQWEYKSATLNTLIVFNNG